MFSESDIRRIANYHIKPVPMTRTSILDQTNPPLHSGRRVSIRRFCEHLQSLISNFFLRTFILFLFLFQQLFCGVLGWEVEQLFVLFLVPDSPPISFSGSPIPFPTVCDAFPPELFEVALSACDCLSRKCFSRIPSISSSNCCIVVILE